MQAWVLGFPRQDKGGLIFMFIKNTVLLCNVSYMSLEMDFKRCKEYVTYYTSCNTIF